MLGFRLLTQTATWLRLARPSLVRMCCTWFWAVRSDSTSRWAIWRLVTPPAHQLGHLQLAAGEPERLGSHRAELGLDAVGAVDEGAHAQGSGLLRRAGGE